MIVIQVDGKWKPPCGVVGTFGAYRGCHMGKGRPPRTREDGITKCEDSHHCLIQGKGYDIHFSSGWGWGAAGMFVL